MSETKLQRRHDQDGDWQDVARQFHIRPDTTYLNHGSFGVSPDPVRLARAQWTQRLESQPMDFYVREFEPALEQAKGRLASFMGAVPDNMVFAENATFGMNIVADSFPLARGNQVLINNHEYGAVHRIWGRACQRSGSELVVTHLPEKIEDPQQIAEAVLKPATDKTRLIVVSHITSPTALIMPVAAICAAAAKRNIAVCIDGPHALAQLPVQLDQLGCAFYTASCHKWLSAPLGSGFLYVHPEWQHCVQPQLKSWGRLLPAMPEQWFEEFIWSGTRDPAAYLSVPTAIEFLESIGLESFRHRTHGMARRTQQRLIELTGQQPIAAEFDRWYAAMSHVPLPAGDWSPLQHWLWEEHRIEVPVIEFENRWYIRVSHHLYTTQGDIDKLMIALGNAFNR